MASATATNIKKHNAGNQIKVVADITLDDTNTWIVPHLSYIEDWYFSCDADDSAGGVISAGHTLTFAAGTEISGKIFVYGR